MKPFIVNLVILVLLSFVNPISGQVFPNPSDSLTKRISDQPHHSIERISLVIDLLNFHLISGNKIEFNKTFRNLDGYNIQRDYPEIYLKYVDIKINDLLNRKEIDSAKTLLNTIHKVKEDSARVNFFLTLAFINQVSKKDSLCLLNIDKAQRVAINLDNEYLINKVNLQKSQFYKKRRKAKLAIEFAKEGLEYFKENNHHKEIGSALTYLTYSYYLLAQYDSVMYYGTEAIPYLEKSYSYNAICSNYNVMATVLQNSGRLNKSIEYYFAGLKIAEEFHIDYLTAAFLYNLANSHMLIKSMEKAKLYFLQCFDFAKGRKDTLSYLYAANALGEIAEETDLIQAADYYNLALNLAKKINASFVYSFIYSSKSYMAANKGQINLAQTLQDSAFYWGSKFKSVEYSIPLKRNQAFIYKKAGKYDKAIKLLKECLETCNTSGFREPIVPTLKSLSEIYKLKNNLDLALKYSDRAQTITDSLNISSIMENLVNQELEYEYAKAERIQLLEIEKSELEAEQEIRTSKMISYISITIGSAFILLTIMLVIMNLTKRRKNKLLNENNILIENQRDELSKLVDQLSEITSELKMTNATKDRLFSIIAHDLKNPFNVICGYSNLLMSEDLDTKSIKEFSERINISSFKLVEMINNLLLWSRSQLGQIGFVPKEFAIEEILNTVIDLTRLEAEIKQITILPEFDIRKNTSTNADPNMIKIVLQNLVSNAIKYTSKEGNIWVGFEKTKKNKLRVFVKDNGHGLTTEEIEQIKTEVYVTSKEGTSGEKGTGLGLSICKEFINKHGSELEVKSINGAEFSFELPNNLVNK